MRILTFKPEKAVLGVGLMLIISMLLISPITTPPDELAHIAYPQTLLQTLSLPAYTSSFDAWESHQPPLYYLASVPFALASNSLPFAHQIFFLRLTSVACAVFSLILMYKTALRLFPSETMSRLVILSFFAIPSVVYAYASFSNDALVLAISTALLGACIFLRDKTSISSSALFGIIIGLALLTKFALYPVLAIAVIWFFWKKNILHIVLSLSISLLVSAWWFIHNIIRTGDITGLTNTFKLWGDQSTYWTLNTVKEFIVKISASAIGLFGKLQISLPLWSYIAFAALVIIGLIPTFRKKTTIIRISLLMVCAMLLFVVIQNVSFFQPQGRYLFACFPFVAILLGFGVAQMPTIKHRIYFFSAFGATIIMLNILSLTAIHSFYNAHPLPMLEKDRRIDLMKLKWNGSFQTIQPNVPISSSFNIFTLADLRILSERSPKLVGKVDSPSAACTLFYKRIGDIEFNKERSFELSTNSSDFSVSFPDQKPTLIQDVALSCSLNPQGGTLTIQQLAIMTQ